MDGAQTDVNEGGIVIASAPVRTRWCQDPAFLSAKTLLRSLCKTVFTH